MVYEKLTDEALSRMVFNGEAEAVCTECGAASTVEPDAEGYNCAECDGEGTVTSPLVVLKIV